MVERMPGHATENEIFELLEKTEVGVWGTVVCDTCNTRIRDEEFVQLYITFLGRVPAIYLRCARCHRGDIETPTRNADEWLVEAKIVFYGRIPKLQPVKVIRHSPPEEGL